MPLTDSFEMTYISTRGYTTPTSFTDALLQGMAPDGGLFVPSTWPRLPDLSAAQSYTDIALEVMSPFIGDAIPRTDLKKIIEATYARDVFADPDVTPLRPLGDDLFLLELFHGPTLAFKDVALQLLGRLFDYVLQKSNQKITIVGATSGDTGSAAIEGCKGVKNIAITILHPKGRTSDIQRRQMTTVDAPNVHNIAIEGNFDDCQALVKQAFADHDLRTAKNLSAINSINWARIIAQTVYYIVAAKQLKTTPAFAVPTGNFGNIFAAYVGKQMGGDIGPLVIGSNRNDILTRFFETGSMTLESVTPSYSPSMDIQISSNFERALFDLMGRDAKTLVEWMTTFKNSGSFAVPEAVLSAARQNFMAARCSDDDTVATIRKTYDDHGIILDPHTAVGLHALQNSGLEHHGPCVTLACAHPAKFPDVVQKAIGITPPLPAHLADLMDRKEHYTVMPNDYDSLKKFLLRT